MEQLRLELGVSGNIFELDYHTFKDVILTKSWVEDTWKFVSEYNISLNPEIAMPACRRENDIPLMDIVVKSKYLDKSNLTWFNKCRMYLKVFFLSDIVTSDGQRLREDILSATPNSNSHLNLGWPVWGKPPTSAWSIWRRTLRILLTDGISLEVNKTLGAWINFDYSNWEWFLSKDNSKLYRRHGDQWTRYSRISRSVRHNRFRPQNLHCFEPATQSISLTTVKVTRSSITADPPGMLSTKPTPSLPLLNLLQPEKFPWLFNAVQRTPDITKLLHDLQKGTELAMSDGSYYPDSNVTTSAWILESSDGTQSISGLTTPFFSPTCNGAYRSEISGLLAIIHITTYLTLEHNLSEPTITIGCDNIKALTTCFDMDYLHRNPTAKHADLLSGIAGLLRLNLIKINHRHVYAHQDDDKDYEDLPRLAQMNVRMDWLAKFASSQIIEKHIVPPKSSHHPLGFIAVTVHGKVIPHQIKHDIYNAISEKLTHQWWISKGRYNIHDIPLLHWEVCAAASTSQSKSDQKFSAKWTTGHLATGTKMMQWKKRAKDNCPFCLAPEETTYHILTCPHDNSKNIWESSFETLIKSLTRIDTESELLSTLTYDLHCWRHAKPFLLTQSLSISLQPIFTHLRQIQYDKFLEGLIPKTLIQYQDNYYRQKESCHKTGKTCGKKVYKLLWNLTSALWKGRNEQLHQTDRIKDLQGLPLVLQAIKNEFNLGLHRLPPSEFSVLFATSFETLSKRSLDSLRHWLLTIRLGRSLHGGIDIIADVFTPDGPYRSWLGLPSNKASL